MESQSDLFSPELKIDTTAKMHIRTIASWAMVIVAVTVLGYVLNILELIINPGGEPRGFESEGFSPSVFAGQNNVAGTIITILIGLTVNYFLYRFASTVSSSITGMNQEKFSASFRHLKTYFAITSIFMMLFLLLILIVVLAFL